MQSGVHILPVFSLPMDRKLVLCLNVYSAPRTGLNPL